MTTIDFSVLQPLVNELALGILTALASFITVKLCAVFKAKRDGDLGQIVDNALNMGIAYAMSKLTSLQDQHAGFDIKSEIAADAVNYTLQHVPEALKALKLDGEHIRRMIEARLHLAEPSAPDEAA